MIGPSTRFCRHRLCTPYTFDWMHVFGLMYIVMVRAPVAVSQGVVAYYGTLRTAPVFKKKSSKLMI